MSASAPRKPGKRSARREFLAGAAAVGALFASCSRDESQTSALAPSDLGEPVRGYGERSPFETTERAMRASKTPEASSSRTPLADTYGTLTPSALHFERHHSGVPQIDPAQHELMIHGMVERPLMLTMEELRGLPSESRICFLECSGNSGGEWSEKGGPTVQLSHGLASCSEWTGVPLRTVLELSQPQDGAAWLLAEGADPCGMQRSLPLDKALDDCLLAYAQNGEAIRPEQGYPLRLIAPGVEGNANVKWLRRIKLAPGPYHTRDETSKYSELMPDGTAWQFTLEMDAKSVITRPSGGHQLSGPGPTEVTGLAWSGRGAITRVDVSTDGGASWVEARLQEPVLPMAFTRFRFDWQWDGAETSILSRAVDDTGYVQPTLVELRAERGGSSAYHNNRIKAWTIAADGSVANG